MTEDSGHSPPLGPPKATSGIRVQFLRYEADVYDPEQIQDRGKEGGEVAGSCEL